MEALGLSAPTEIQRIGVPSVLAGGDVLLMSQTGSGKTLAYLLPLIDRIRRDEKELGVETRGKRPRALVLLPTRELVHQVGAGVMRAGGARLGLEGAGLGLGARGRWCGAGGSGARERRPVLPSLPHTHT